MQAHTQHLLLCFGLPAHKCHAVLNVQEEKVLCFSHCLWLHRRRSGHRTEWWERQKHTPAVPVWYFSEMLPELQRTSFLCINSGHIPDVRAQYIWLCHTLMNIKIIPCLQACLYGSMEVYKLKTNQIQLSISKQRLWKFWESAHQISCCNPKMIYCTTWDKAKIHYMFLVIGANLPSNHKALGLAPVVQFPIN